MYRVELCKTFRLAFLTQTFMERYAREGVVLRDSPEGIKGRNYPDSSMVSPWEFSSK